MRRLLALLMVVGCGAPSATSTTAAPPAPSESVSEVVPVLPFASFPSASGASVPGAALVVLNPTEVDIDIYGAYLVDETGTMGTVQLWPHRFDCEGRREEPHLVPKQGGELRLAAPNRAYRFGQCEPGPTLPPGAYVLRLDSGYGQDLYAAAPLELPLKESVTLRFHSHADLPRPCSPALARRAAILAMAAAEDGDGLPQGFFAGCDVNRARCGDHDSEAMPPEGCSITFDDGALFVDRPAGDDAPRGLLAWIDREVVYAERPEITRTSASKIALGGKTLVVSGTTSHHMHEHGGDAARIGHLTLKAHNPLARALPYRIEDVEWLVDYSCGLPAEVSRHPKLLRATPRQLPPGTSEVEVSFEGQGAYMAHCDRFATRVTLGVEGQRMRVTSEHEVTRMEPLRDEF